MPWCPECGTAYDEAVAACPRCRVVLTAEPPAPAEQGQPEVVHRVPDATSGALLCGMLEHHGIQTILRSAFLPGYGMVRRDWSTTAWGEIMVERGAVADAKALIAEYLAALERGGRVTDEDVESGEAP